MCVLGASECSKLVSTTAEKSLPITKRPAEVCYVVCPYQKACRCGNDQPDPADGFRDGRQSRLSKCVAQTPHDHTVLFWWWSALATCLLLRDTINCRLRLTIPRVEMTNGVGADHQKVVWRYLLWMLPGLPAGNLSAAAVSRDRGNIFYNPHNGSS